MPLGATCCLSFNAALYALFAARCTFLPARAANAIGREALSRSGISAYPAVSGSLQPGLAIFFFKRAKAGAQRSGLVLALAMHAPSVGYRCATLAKQRPVGSTTLRARLFETALLVCAVVLCWGARAGIGRVACVLQIADYPPAEHGRGRAHDRFDRPAFPRP